MKVCILSLCLIAVTLAQIPIPKREVGYAYKNGSPSAAVHLDFYIDQICPDSKQALPTILKLADSYGPQTLQLTTHLFPLPYHRNGFFAAKGSHIVNKLMNASAVYTWISLVYDNIDSLTNANTMNLSDNQNREKFATLAAKLDLDPTEFKNMLLDETIEEDTRVGWKYSCTRGVAATPTFMVNDVVVGADPSWTVDDWKKVIDPLLGVTSPQLKLRPVVPQV